MRIAYAGVFLYRVFFFFLGWGGGVGFVVFRLAAISKEREKTKLKSSIVTTHIQQLGTFYPAEPKHQV